MEAIADPTTKAVSVLDFQGPWILVHVKPGGERKMANDMAARGIQHFLPLEKVVSVRPNGHRRKYDRLVWTGYLFVCGGDDAWYAIGDSMWNIHRTVIPERQRDRLVNFLHAYEAAYNQDDTAETRGLRVSDVVRFIAGPFRHEYNKGVVSRIDGRRLWVMTLFMGTIREVEIENLSDIERDN